MFIEKANKQRLGFFNYKNKLFDTIGGRAEVPQALSRVAAQDRLQSTRENRSFGWWSYTV
jgi:hypothetical protein